MDKATERYLKRLRRALICPREDRERLMKDAGDLLESFAQENPGAFYKDYAASFGQPEDFAAEMLSNLDPEDLAEARARRKRTLLGLVAAAAALAVLLAGFWFGRHSRQPPSEPSAPPAASPTPSGEPPAEESGEPGPAGDAMESYLEASYTDSGEIVHREAVAVLTRLGVLQAMGDGDFRPEGTITRGEAAKLMTLIMNGGRDLSYSEQHEPGFTDTQGHWAESYIQYCADLGIVYGNADGSFTPNEELTGIELAKMAVCALGYDATAYRLNGDSWSVRVDEIARITSLYEGLEGVTIGGSVTRDTAAQILFNTLRATPKRVVPAYNTADGTVTWQYVDSTREDGSPSDLLLERFNLALEDIAFD